MSSQRREYAGSALSLPFDKYVPRALPYISLMFMCSVLNKSYSNT